MYTDCEGDVCKRVRMGGPLAPLAPPLEEPEGGFPPYLSTDHDSGLLRAARAARYAGSAAQRA